MMFRFNGFLLFAAVVLAACSGGDGKGAQEIHGELTSNAPDVRFDSETETETETNPYGCEPIVQGALVPAQEEPEKFSLSMYHFNLQYVAGGLTGIIDNPDMEYNEEEIEDLIITESFTPILDVLLDHPTWGFDLEMQGYMLEVISVRHPNVLQKMFGLV